jgi:hypothetical protein
MDICPVWNRFSAASIRIKWQTSPNGISTGFAGTPFLSTLHFAYNVESSSRTLSRNAVSPRLVVVHCHGNPPPRPRLHGQPATEASPPHPLLPRTSAPSSTPALVWTSSVAVCTSPNPHFSPRSFISALLRLSTSATGCGADLAPRMWLSPSRAPGAPRHVHLPRHAWRGGQQGSRDVLGHSCRRGLEGQRCRDELAFVNFRTLMVATDWSDKDAMGELAIAGHVCAVLQPLGILAHLQVLQAFCDSIVTILLFVYCTHYILRTENLNQNNQCYQILTLF